MSANKDNQREIARTAVEDFLRQMFRPGDVFEVRAPKCADKPGGTFRATVSGYYTYEQIGKAAKDITDLNVRGVAPGIYITMNPVAPALLARANCKLEHRAKSTTADADVVARRWLLIDCDPVRPSDISATEGELALAQERARAVREWLAARGWPDPIEVMSGNGAHLLFAVDLPTDDGGLCKGVLAALAERFDDEHVKIDRSVFNAARITKVAGTMARKGENLRGVQGVEDRPHRRAAVIAAPAERMDVGREFLEAVASETAPTPNPATRPLKPNRSGSSKSPSAAAGTQRFQSFDHTPDGVRSYLRQFGIVVTNTVAESDGTWLYLDRCPVAADCTATSGSDIAVVVKSDGVIGYKNQHNRGAGLGWLDVREALEPGYKAWAALREAHQSGTPVGRIRLRVHGGDGERLVVSALDGDGGEIARDKIDRDSSVSRARFVKSVHEAIELSDDEKSQIDAAIRQLEPPPEGGDQPPPPPASLAELQAGLDERRQQRLSETPPEIVREAEEMLLNPNLIDLIDEDIAAAGVVGEEVLAMTLYMQGVSRLLDDPISIIVQGTSSSGKSYVIIRVATLFPPEAVMLATDITANALYYLPPGRLVHCWVVGGERSRDESDEKAEAKRAMREMISAGELRKIIPLRQQDGSFISAEIYQPGPIAFSESTTNTHLFDEDANRCLLLSTDESSDQTRRIVRAAARRAESGVKRVSDIPTLHHTLQRLLRRVHVVIPFATKLADCMPAQRPDARRAFNQMIAMIRAVALLHQRQRATGEIEDGDVINATVDDYIIARRLLGPPFGRSLGGAMADAVTRFADRLATTYGSNPFTSANVVEGDGVITSKGKVNQYLRSLADAGVVECVEEGRGSKPHVWRVVGELPEGGADWLPTVDQLREAAA
ncbi:MAG: hypothetical protein KF699_06240 [Phycisphaeraceae bacterium]|nr:hypothetical protein [Phycisphaeraceae bacterium]